MAALLKGSERFDAVTTISSSPAVPEFADAAELVETSSARTGMEHASATPAMSSAGNNDPVEGGLPIRAADCPAKRPDDPLLWSFIPTPP